MDSFKTYFESFLCEKMGRRRIDEIKYTDKQGQEVKFICVTPDKTGSFKKFKLDGDETEKTFSLPTVLKYKNYNDGKGYPKSLILDKIYRGKAKERYFTEMDNKFREDYNSLQGQVFVEDEETGKIEFPLINKSVDMTEDNIKKLEELQDSSLFKDDLFEAQEENEDDSEDDAPVEKEYDKEWQKKELDVAKSLNHMLRKYNVENSKISPYRFYSCQIGGSKKSDVLVCADHKTDGKFNNGLEYVQNLGDSVNYGSIKKQGQMNDAEPDDNDRFFFVEVKKDYKTASYFKFFMKYQFSESGGNFGNITRSSESDKMFNAKLSKVMCELCQKNEAVNKQFKRIHDNVVGCINELMKIDGIQKQFKFKEIQEFPRDFDELAKVFNFYILEWQNKLRFLKSEYFYMTLAGIKQDNVKVVENQIKYVQDKIERLAGTKDAESISHMSSFEKFKQLYKMFVTSDDEARKAGRYVLFTIKDLKSVGLIDAIEDYYNELKDVKYLEVGDDIYYFGMSKNKSDIPQNPLGIPTAINFRDLVENGKIKIEVVVQDAQKLKLVFQITDSGLETNGGGFESLKDIDSGCDFVKTETSLKAKKTT